MSPALLILKNYTTFKDVQMILKDFLDISTGFRYKKKWKRVLRPSIETSMSKCKGTNRHHEEDFKFFYDFILLLMRAHYWCFLAIGEHMWVNPNWHEAGHFPLPCPFLGQILSAEFSSKITKLFWRWKLTSMGLIWHPAKLIWFYQNAL